MLSDAAKSKLKTAVELGNQLQQIEHLRTVGPAQLVQWTIEYFPDCQNTESIKANVKEAEQFLAGLLGLA